MVLKDFKEKFYLASKSPRRKELLELIGLKPIVVSIDVNEDFEKDIDIESVPIILSKRKMESAKEKISDGIILTADTIVVIENEILGKPINEVEAVKMLSKLSGKEHKVISGFTLFNSKNKKEISDIEITSVKFCPLTEKEIQNYIEIDNPTDKAGAYGIQDGFGAAFISEINGCYYNVVGLPLSKVYHSILMINND